MCLRRRRTVEPEVVAAQESDWSTPRMWHPFDEREATREELQRRVHAACERAAREEQGCE